MTQIMGEKPPLDYSFSDDDFLLLAAETEDLSGLKELISKGVDVNLCNPYGQSPLILAAEENFTNGVEFLIHSGADLKRDGISALHAAISRDHLEIAEILVSNGVSLTSIDSSNGWTALDSAALLSSPLTLRWVLDRELEINRRDNGGTTPLIHAAVSGSLEKVAMLLQAGADPHIKDNEGNTALDWALMNEFDVVAKELRRAMDQ